MAEAFKAKTKNMELKYKLSVFRRAFNNDIIIIRVVFVLFVLIIISSAFTFTVKKYMQSADVIENALLQKDSIIRSGIYSVKPEIKEIRQLREQYEMISEIKKTYQFIAHRYSSYNYSFSIFFTIFSILTGILGFILVKKGWDNTENYYLKSAFLISFFCSSLFGLLPNVLGAKDNIKNNMTKYHLYSGIQLDIYNLASDGKGYLARNTKQSIDSLKLEIISITDKIKENQNLYFDIYMDKVPSDFRPLK